MSVKPDLSRTNLRGLDAPGIDLHETLFRRSNLSGANLSRANLRGADLSNAVLIEADLRGADLSGADLKDVKNLTQEQLKSIHYDRNDPPRNLPEGLTLPQPYGSDEDGEELLPEKPA